MNKICYISTLLILFISIELLIPSLVSANGFALSFKTLQAGPYVIEVGVVPKTPSIGTFHMTMTVSDGYQEKYQDGIKITITGLGPEPMGDVVGPITATNDPTNPFYYEINPSVDTEGIWVFTVNIEGDLGNGSTDFPVTQAI